MRWLALMRQHGALKPYLEKSLGVQVQLLTAPDFDTFQNRTLAGVYDVVLTAPHLGVAAALAGSWQLLARSQNKSAAYILARADARFDRLEEAGGLVIMPPSSAMVSIVARHMLAQTGKPYVISYQRSHMDAFLQMLQGRSSLAVVGVAVFRRIEQEYPGQYRLLAESSPLPGFLWLVRQDLANRWEMPLLRVLEQFGRTAEGKVYFEQTGLVGFESVPDTMLPEFAAMLAPFREEVR